MYRPGLVRRRFGSTPSPTASTVPATSYPTTAGSFGASGYRPTQAKMVSEVRPCCARTATAAGRRWRRVRSLHLQDRWVAMLVLFYNVLLVRLDPGRTREHPSVIARVIQEVRQALPSGCALRLEVTDSVHRCRLPFCDVTVGLVGAAPEYCSSTPGPPSAKRSNRGRRQQIAGCQVTHCVDTQSISMCWVRCSWRRCSALGSSGYHGRLPTGSQMP